MKFPHPHIYEVIEDCKDYSFSGLVCRRKVWKCRVCPATKTRINGKVLTL